jgi:hypothetical protein
MARRKRSFSSKSNKGTDPAGAAILLAAAPLLIGGAVVLAITISGAASPVGQWFRTMFGTSRTSAMREMIARYARGERPFAALRDAIVGSAKGAVVAVFGPPRTAILGRGATKLSIWRADTWYYPLDRTERSAIAIRFEGNVARDVEKISVPTASIE